MKIGPLIRRRILFGVGFTAAAITLGIVGWLQLPSMEGIALVSLAVVASLGTILEVAALLRMLMTAESPGAGACRRCRSPLRGLPVQPVLNAARCSASPSHRKS